MTPLREHITRRSLALLLIMALGFSVITFKFGYVMIFQGLEVNKTANQRAESRRPGPPRGRIVGHDGSILAISIQRPSLYANPRAVRDPRRVIEKLAPVIDLSPREMVRRLQKDRYFVWLERRVDPDKVQTIKKFDFHGIGFVPEYERIYPKGTLAGQVLGFVGVENQGLEGVEKQFNRILSRSEPSSRSVPVSSGRFQRGPLLRLTLDQAIQHIVEQELKKMAQRESPRNAMAIVMRPESGRILAMANWPFFDPNSYQEFSEFRRRNRAITSSFEPGSTLKAMTLSVGLAENAYSPDSRFDCPGYIYLPRAKHTLNCYAKHGTIPLPEILIKSCNVGTVKAVQQIKSGVFYQYLREFGFGNWTGIRLPGEARGNLRSPSRWSSLTQPSMAIGQGLSTTTLQLTAALGSIVNDGVLIRPRILDSITRESDPIKRTEPFRIRRVLPEDVARTMQEYMRRVVTRGTGQKAGSTRYQLAGKTGTAQKADLEKGGYYKDRVLASFIGFGPVKQPSLVTAVVVDEPTRGKYGGDVAAPVFRRIMERSLQYFERQEP